MIDGRRSRFEFTPLAAAVPYSGGARKAAGVVTLNGREGTRALRSRARTRRRERASPIPIIIGVLETPTPSATDRQTSFRQPDRMPTTSDANANSDASHAIA